MDASTTHRVRLEIEMPEDSAGLLLPEGVERRLHALLDKQDSGDALTDDERAEAEGLVDLADLLSLLRLRASGVDSAAGMTTSRDSIPLSLQRRVRLRAGQRCEYCGIPQAGQEAAFHMDHVQPRREGGPTTLENLALSCVSCSLRKGARSEARDPQTGEMAGMYNPRTQSWEDHFELVEDFSIVGRTSAGRAAVELLRMNRTAAMKIRRSLGR